MEELKLFRSERCYDSVTVVEAGFAKDEEDYRKLIGFSADDKPKLKVEELSIKRGQFLACTTKVSPIFWPGVKKVLVGEGGRKK